MTYDKRKVAARETIINLYEYMQERALSWGELETFQDTIYSIARRNGLLKEIRENGIL